jgi:hypothetical protein
MTGTQPSPQRFQVADWVIRMTTEMRKTVGHGDMGRPLLSPLREKRRSLAILRDPRHT